MCAAPRSFPVLISSGSVTVKIYRVRRKNGREQFTLAWYEGNSRKTEQFSKFVTARDEGKLKADQLAAGELSVAEFSRAERAEYLALLRLAGDVSPVTALEEWRGCRDLVGADMKRACRAWAASRGLGEANLKLSVRDAVNQYLQAQRRLGFNTKVGAEKTLNVRQGEAGRRSFVSVLGDTPLALVSPAMVVDWLGNTHTDPVSHNTHRKRLMAFFTWCRKRGLLPGEIRHAVERTDRAKEDRSKPVVPALPADLRRCRQIMAAQAPHYLPSLVLASAVGLRPGEVHEQIWSDIDLDKARLWVTAAKPNTPEYRFVDLPANAVVVLREFERESGPVCENLAIDRIRLLCRSAGLMLPENGFRKGWISARVVVTGSVAQTAQEGGTSEKVINRYYRRPWPREVAEAWFAVWD